jgi:hypothetical protein
LSRIDAQRVKAEGRLAALFRPGITAAEVARLAPTPEHRAASHRAEMTDLIATLEALRARCRKESMSWSSDWGEEMKYRYQEHLMTEPLDALHSFKARVDEPRVEQGGDAASSPTGFSGGPRKTTSTRRQPQTSPLDRGNGKRGRREADRAVPAVGATLRRSFPRAPDDRNEPSDDVSTRDSG